MNWTPEFMGFGNQLYLWCWAHSGSTDRQRRMVLMTEKMRYWAERVPEFARERIIERGDVSFLDRRGHYWAENEKYTGDPRGFTEESRATFVTEVLLPSPLLQGVRGTPYTNDDVIVVNVRRGDYYSDWFRPEHGFDVEGYLRIAVPSAITQDGAAGRIHVISDDLSWCRKRLAWLSDHARLTFADPADGPASNFRDLSSARRLVIANSTFSLWAAFVSSTLHRHNERQVWAPAFFQRRYGPGRCYEYDQSWSFVDDLPGGGSRTGWYGGWPVRHRTEARCPGAVGLSRSFLTTVVVGGGVGRLAWLGGGGRPPFGWVRTCGRGGFWCDGCVSAALDVRSWLERHGLELGAAVVSSG